MYHNSGLCLLKKNFIFQEDNEPKHASKLCRNYKNSQEKSGLLRGMNWSQSADLKSNKTVMGQTRQKSKTKSSKEYC